MKIVTDTSALYSPEEGKLKGFLVLPLCVTVNNKTYREYAQMTSAMFLDILRDGAIPSTSQPSVGDIMEVFEGVEDDLLVITMADGLSGCYQNVLGVKETSEKGRRIHVIDSMTLCGPHRYLVELALKLSQEGKEMDEIIDEINKRIPSAKSFIIPQDFSFLKRGGRVTGISATIGEKLKIIPVMTQTKDAKRLERYALKRTMKGAVNEIITCFKKMGIDQTYRIYVSHGGDLALAREVVSKLQQEFIDIEIVLMELSPVFIAQGGPGCIAIQTVKM